MFGTAVFEQPEALPFSNRWCQIVADSGIGYLAMKEAMHFENEFRDWKTREKDRNDLLETLAVLFWNRCSFLTRSVMSTADFKALPHKQATAA